MFECSCAAAAVVAVLLLLLLLCCCGQDDGGLFEQGLWVGGARHGHCGHLGVQGQIQRFLLDVCGGHGILLLVMAVQESARGRGDRCLSGGQAHVVGVYCGQIHIQI